jgi:hypothetical protein
LNKKAAMDISTILKNNPEIADNLTIKLSATELKDFADYCLDRGKQQQPAAPKVQETEQPISQPEAIKFLGKTRQTLTAWRKKGIITGHVLGGRVYFLKSELLAAIKK